MRSGDAVFIQASLMLRKESNEKLVNSHLCNQKAIAESTAKVKRCRTIFFVVVPQIAALRRISRSNVHKRVVPRSRYDPSKFQDADEDDRDMVASFDQVSVLALNIDKNHLHNGVDA